jgi:hypothetical protein
MNFIDTHAHIYPPSSMIPGSGHTRYLRIRCFRVYMLNGRESIAAMFARRSIQESVSDDGTSSMWMSKPTLKASWKVMAKWLENHLAIEKLD